MKYSCFTWDTEHVCELTSQAVSLFRLSQLAARDFSGVGDERLTGRYLGGSERKLKWVMFSSPCCLQLRDQEFYWYPNLTVYLSFFCVSQVVGTQI